MTTLNKTSWGKLLLLCSCAFPVFGLTQNIGIGVINAQKTLHVGGTIRFDTLSKLSLPGLIQHNSLGDLSTLSFPGNSSLYLSGAGTWLPLSSGGSSLSAGSIVLSETNPNVALANAGYALVGQTTLGSVDVDSTVTINANSWAALPVSGAPPAKESPQLIWAGDRVFVFGGFPGFSLGMYVPSINRWENIPPIIVDDVGYNLNQTSAIWTGTDLIIWGGRLSQTSTTVNDGFKYNLSTKTWSKISSVNAPSPRHFHSAIWTGTEMIIWGGSTFWSSFLNTGGKYNPVTNTWTPMSITNAPLGRFNSYAGEIPAPTGIWTGTEFIVWGGYGSSGLYLNDGARYNPTTNTWTPLPVPASNIITARRGHSIIWTGADMIVWGGENNGVEFNDGASLRVSNGTWMKISQTNAPSIRSGHAGLWTGSNMLIFGGSGGGNGKLYNPLTDSWSSITSYNTDLVYGNTIYATNTIWTGNEMISWGHGAYGSSNMGARYFTSQKTATIPTVPKMYYLYKKQ